MDSGGGERRVDPKKDWVEITLGSRDKLGPAIFIPA